MNRLVCAVYAAGCWPDAPLGGPIKHRSAITQAALGSASFWICIYLSLMLAPLVLLMLGERPRGGGFWWDFSLALGYSGLVLTAMQFALTARFRRATAPFGIDIIYYFHRFLAAAGFALLLAHLGILLRVHPELAARFDPRELPAHITAGWLALLAFSLIMISSIWRKQLRIEYDRWRRLHVVLAVLGMLFAAWHVLVSGSYLSEPWKRGMWIGVFGLCLFLVAYVRVLRPWMLLRQRYRVVEVVREPGRAWTLRLRAEQGPALQYQAGQFAWLSLGCSPFAMREHPFSFSSSPSVDQDIAFTIKELGDFTETVGRTPEGTIAYVDGPYGVFGIDAHPAASGFVFVAGGVGIAPIMSILQELAARGERRPLWLFYGNRRWERVLFRAELQQLAERLNLQLVHVLGEPPADWQGEQGVIDTSVLARHWPAPREGVHVLVCGPDPMIRLVERSLRDLGVSPRAVHSEIFDLA